MVGKRTNCQHPVQTHVHLCAALLMASCNAEWKCVHRLLSGVAFPIVGWALTRARVISESREHTYSVRPWPLLHRLVMDPGEADNTQQPARTQQQHRSSIPSFLFIIFLLFMLTNHSGDEFLARNHYQETLQSLTYQLSNFTAWVNGSESNFIMVCTSLRRRCHI